MIFCISDTDIKKVNLLNSVGGKLRSTQQDALLRRWKDYEKMLGQFEDGLGSMDKEAEKTANSWEGSLNSKKTVLHLGKTVFLIRITVYGMKAFRKAVGASPVCFLNIFENCKTSEYPQASATAETESGVFDKSSFA